jgi:hypothetical protein
MIQIQCPPCIVCKKRATMEVSEEGLYRWQKLGQLVQDAFPRMSDGEREQLITGTHPECWEVLFPDEPEEEEAEGDDLTWREEIRMIDEQMVRWARG